MLALLSRGGIKQPYTVVTMDFVWLEAAAETGMPRYFFKNKLPMLKFCINVLRNDGEVLALTTKDGERETMAMRAALYALGAKEFTVACDI